mgnify:CR=1 FL=1
MMHDYAHNFNKASVEMIEISTNNIITFLKKLSAKMDLVKIDLV